MSFPVPGGLPGHVLLALALTAFVAAMARGFSGFGNALIFVPVASALIGPKAAVPLLLIIDTVLTLALIPNAWKLGDRREIATMATGALAGIPLGAWLLVWADPLIIRWAIVVLASAMLILLASGWRYRGKPGAPATVGVGVLSGIFSGAAQVGGPPVVAYWLGSAISGAAARANIILYFALSAAITVTSYLAGGLLTRSVLGLALLAGPIYALGLIIGARLFGIVSESTFRRICFALIAAAVVFGLPILDAVIR